MGNKLMWGTGTSSNGSKGERRKRKDDGRRKLKIKMSG
jgi:hypothetical protein